MAKNRADCNFTVHICTIEHFHETELNYRIFEVIHINFLQILYLTKLNLK